jgi:hypothetical protein
MGERCGTCEILITSSICPTQYTAQEIVQRHLSGRYKQQCTSCEERRIQLAVHWQEEHQEELTLILLSLDKY